MDANAPAESSRITELQQAIVGTGWQTHLGGIAKVAGSRMGASQRTDGASYLPFNRKQSHASEGRRR